MISPSEIKVKAEKKYVLYLQSIVQEIPFSRIVISGDKSYSKSLSEYEKEILSLINQSRIKKGYGYSIDYQTVKTKNIGIQDLPISIYFDSEKDFLKYIGKEKEVENFYINAKLIINHFPELRGWIIHNPLKVTQYQNRWESIIKVCNFFKSNPHPNKYIRELPINVHTKFIESNQTIIRDLLDVIIEPFIKQDEKDFEKRFNLKYREPLVRFKVLDEKISQSFFSGLSDISIPVSQFEGLNLPLTQVLVVENKTTLYTTLTLPKMDSTIAVFGSGYSVHNLKNTMWLKKLKLYYWGDFDVQGFEILSQVRNYFPNTISILMDKITFNKYFENDIGTPSNITVRLQLNEAEQNLYNLLKMNNWRLEQEKIPYDYVNRFFEGTNQY